MCSTSVSKSALSKLLVCFLICHLAGCNAGGFAGLADGALGTVGLRRAGADSVGATRIRLRVQASDNLNASSSGSGLSLVVRIYQLREPESFLAAPLGALAGSDRELLGRELVGTRELVLTPGQSFDGQELVSAEANYIAIAGFFRNPAGGRAKLLFGRAASVSGGVLIGAHACAFTVTIGEALGGTRDEPGSLSGVQCGI